eukprot:CAMPEP_0203958908 /NCGR_PEP_ID=MMETSP0359-20131031/90179_1 /ASSEMBLY_ACC=CAM_ASM_000338 /TAXON_ID=268821 /ORGANISM="Scrippsiella Hangoei, Strain SHTV-5" /LENGTH=52 /DNA_ID=CAMNT_0050892925 /DNA_START=292 /DNA_END=450 /DNA_ORIENTATION=-
MMPPLAAGELVAGAQHRTLVVAFGGVDGRPRVIGLGGLLLLVIAQRNVQEVI